MAGIPMRSTISIYGAIWQDKFGIKKRNWGKGSATINLGSNLNFMVIFCIMVLFLAETSWFSGKWMKMA